MNRRDFLVSMSSYLALPVIPSLEWIREVPRKLEILSPSTVLAKDPSKTAFSTYDLTTGLIDEIPMPLRVAHSWVHHPAKSGEGIVVESGGRGFCCVNVPEKTVVSTGRSTGENLFFGGHGEWTTKGLYLSQFNAHSGEGSVSIRDPMTFAELDRFSSYGLFPHQMILRAGGRQIEIANLGHDSHAKGETASLATIDLKSGKLVDRREVRRGIGMLVDYQGKIEDSLLNETAHYLQTAQMAEQESYAVIVHPRSYGVSLWQFEVKRWRAKRFLSFFPDQPLTMARLPGGRHLAVGFTNNTMTFVDTSSFKVDRSFAAVKIPVTSHLYVRERT